MVRVSPAKGPCKIHVFLNEITFTFKIWEVNERFGHVKGLFLSSNVPCMSKDQ